MADELKLPRLARDLPSSPIEVRLLEGDRVALQFPASSSLPLQRWWGSEELSHERAAVRLGRIDGGSAPLLFNHDWDDPIGMIEGGRLSDGRLHVSASLFTTERAREVRAMVDGGLRNVSIGYEIHAMEERSPDHFVATDWEPFEVSIVTVPADPSVGIGRAEDHEPKSVRVTRLFTDPADPANPTEIAMSNDTAQAAPTAETENVTITREAAPKVNAIELEQRRKDAICKLCKGNHIDGRVERHWIETGATLEQVSDELLKILEERGKAASVPAMIGMEKKDVRRYSVLKAFRAVMSKDWNRAGLELEAHRALMGRMALNPRSEHSFFVPLDVQVRDMTAAGVSGSNYLVGTDNLSGSFIELLRNESVVLALGATRLSGLVGNVTIPRQTAAASAYWLANENTQITESQPTIGQLTLTPKNVAALTELSHQLMQQSDPSAEQMVMMDLARTVALAADVAALRGGGVNGQPQGIVGTAGLGVFDTDSTDTYGDVLGAQTDVAAANALRPGCAYVADPTSASLLMRRPRFANSDTPVWDGSLLSGQMAGFPAMATNQMADNTMLFGWWPSLIMAEWGVLELSVNPYSDFTRGLSAVRAWYTMDFGMRYPAAFSYDSSVE